MIKDLFQMIAFIRWFIFIKSDENSFTWKIINKKRFKKILIKRKRFLQVITNKNKYVTMNSYR